MKTGCITVELVTMLPWKTVTHSTRMSNQWIITAMRRQGHFVKNCVRWVTWENKILFLTATDVAFKQSLPLKWCAIEI